MSLENQQLFAESRKYAFYLASRSIRKGRLPKPLPSNATCLESGLEVREIQANRAIQKQVIGVVQHVGGELGITQEGEQQSEPH